MYCFQDGSEVISIKREATDTQQEQQNSAVSITFPEIKAEKEVSCISLYPLLPDFQTSCVVRTLLFCAIHMTVHNTHI
jgi:hypothetical protein